MLIVNVLWSLPNNQRMPNVPSQPTGENYKESRQDKIFQLLIMMDEEILTCAGRGRSVVFSSPIAWAGCE